MAEVKGQLSKFDKRELAKVDEACAEVELNSKLLVLIHDDLTHVFKRVRRASGQQYSALIHQLSV